MNREQVENMMGCFEKAAQSVLAGDRAKLADFGGQKLADVDRVEAGLDTDAEVAVVRLYTSDGKSAQGVIMPHSLHMPKDRELRPGDVHDAVKAAMLSAAPQLADGRA